MKHPERRSLACYSICSILNWSQSTFDSILEVKRKVAISKRIKHCTESMLVVRLLCRFFADFLHYYQEYRVEEILISLGGM